MSELGSIFEDTEASGRAKGPDLKVQASIPRGWLGREDGVLVEVPDMVPYRGEGASSVPRRRGPDDPPGAVRLHLSEQLGERALLRLRGQGGEHPQSGAAGDLILDLTVVAGGPRRRWWLVLLVAAGAGAAGWLGYAALIR